MFGIKYAFITANFFPGLYIHHSNSMRCLYRYCYGGVIRNLGFGQRSYRDYRILVPQHIHKKGKKGHAENQRQTIRLVVHWF
jgi:hypothetical protein